MPGYPSPGWRAKLATSSEASLLHLWASSPIHTQLSGRQAKEEEKEAKPAET